MLEGEERQEGQASKEGLKKKTATEKRRRPSLGSTLRWKTRPLLQRLRSFFFAFFCLRGQLQGRCSRRWGREARSPTSRDGESSERSHRRRWSSVKLFPLDAPPLCILARARARRARSFSLLLSFTLTFRRDGPEAEDGGRDPHIETVHLGGPFHRCSMMMMDLQEGQDQNGKKK